jgi:CheY-like chemotaxis protein
VSTLPAHGVRIAVRDTGIGIPAAKQAKLFQPFQRAGQETGPIEGTGIGLFITKRLAELMHGDVGFRSTEGEGSEFWVDLPIHADSPSVFPPRPAAVNAKLDASVPQRRSILYVEDNPANVEFMRDLIDSLEGFELLTAPNAERGIELAREHRPQIILLDINLPGLSGIEAMRVLQDDARTRDIPVIALTAAASERDQQLGMRAGFRRYLTKPVNVEQFVAALEELR